MVILCVPLGLRVWPTCASPGARRGASSRTSATPRRRSLYLSVPADNVLWGRALRAVCRSGRSLGEVSLSRGLATIVLAVVARRARAAGAGCSASRSCSSFVGVVGSLGPILVWKGRAHRVLLLLYLWGVGVAAAVSAGSAGRRDGALLASLGLRARRGAIGVFASASRVVRRGAARRRRAGGVGLSIADDGGTRDRARAVSTSGSHDRATGAVIELPLPA